MTELTPLPRWSVAFVYVGGMVRAFFDTEGEAQAVMDAFEANKRESKNYRNDRTDAVMRVANSHSNICFDVTEVRSAALEDFEKMRAWSLAAHVRAREDDAEIERLHPIAQTPQGTQP